MVRSKTMARLVLSCVSLLLQWQRAQAADLEVMLLTNWQDALERYDKSETTYGVRYGIKNPQSADQKWIVDKETNTIRSPDDYCLMSPFLKDWQYEDNLLLIMDKCESPPRYNQIWTPGPFQTFRNTLTKDGRSVTYCLDADEASRPYNKIIHGWPCWTIENPAQKWTIFYPGYHIMVGNKCIGLANDNRDGEAVSVMDCRNDPLQLWSYDFYTGTLRLGDPNSPMCVDSDRVGESGIVHMWHCDSNNENQQVDFKHQGGSNPMHGQFFMRDTDNCFGVDQNAQRLVTVSCSGNAAVFSLETDTPDTRCNGVWCQNGASCSFGRCRCNEGTMGADCGIVGQRVRIRATNGMFLSVTPGGIYPNRGLEYAQLDSWKRQQVWYHFPVSNMIKANGRRMCITAKEGEDAVLEVCRWNEPNQEWTYDLATGRLKLRTQNRCLDTQVRSYLTHARMQDCSAGPNANQVWEEVSPDATAINSDMFPALIRHRATPSLCWTVNSGQVGAAACQATTNQLWSFNDAYTGAGALCNAELCAVAKQTTASTGTVALANYDAQRLDELFEYESGSGQIRMVNTNACVAKSSDNKLVLAPCSTTDTTQLWYLAKMDKCISSDFKCLMGKCEFGRCQCQAGFEGPTCSFDSCSLLQCNNGGTCSQGKCTCKDGYAGTFCDDFIKCKGVKCLNGGGCTSAGKCECPVGFSGERCQTKYPSVLLRALEYQAIGLEGGLVTTVVPDLRKKEHQWIWDSAKSMLRSLASTTMCLEQLDAKDVGMAICDTTKPQQKWVYNAAAGKFSTSVGALALGFEESVGGRYRPHLATSYTKPNGLDLGFVEVDRVDLPGSSIRTGDRTKCLSVSTAGAFSTAACDGDDESQQWEYHPQNGVLRLPRVGAPVCLSVAGTAASAVKCNGEDTAQQFDFDFASKRFRNRKSLTCLALGTNSVTTRECSASIPAQQVMRAYFRGFCDVINMCEGPGVCSFGRCSCASDRQGAFCEMTVTA